MDAKPRFERSISRPEREYKKRGRGILRKRESAPLFSNWRNLKAGKRGIEEFLQFLVVASGFRHRIHFLTAKSSHSINQVVA